MTELTVLLNGVHMGYVRSNRNGKPEFSYDDHWKSRRDAYPLSLSLPLSAEKHDPETVLSVMWGYLPDNEHTLARWAKKFQVSPRNPLALLARVGEDCAGAAQFVPPEKLERLIADDDDHVIWLSESDVADRLRRLRNDSGASRNPDDVGQFSLAGAQAKTALLFQNDRWGLPSGRTPTTHILKPPSGEFDGYAENEHYCLTLANELGMVTCESSIRRFEDELCICVKRYDRVEMNGRLWRVHQEDFCQALGIMPQLKYQNEGGPSPENIAKLLDNYSGSPKIDKKAFFYALIFNWLIAGTDAHAKNYSLLLGDNTRVRLAPLYDVSSALPYPQLQRKKLKLAMKIGGHYRWWDVQFRDWVKLGAELGFEEGFTRECLSVLGTTIVKKAPQVRDKLRGEGISHSILDSLTERVVESATRCLRSL